MYIIGVPFKAGRNHYRRDDIYTPTNPSTSSGCNNPNSILVSSLDDLTPVYKHWETGNRNPDCSCCYLGITHSEAKHKEAN